MRLNSTNRVVLDTNILLDIFVFQDPSIVLLMENLRKSTLIAVTCDEILNEFEDVIGRSMFDLPLKDQVDMCLQARNLHQIQPSQTITRAPFRCSDPDDQIFLDLAFAIKPCTLLSKDKAVLKLKNKALGHGVLIRKTLDSV